MDCLRVELLHRPGGLGLLVVVLFHGSDVRVQRVPLDVGLQGDGCDVFLQVSGIKHHRRGFWGGGAARPGVPLWRERGTEALKRIH